MTTELVFTVAERERIAEALAEPYLSDEIRRRTGEQRATPRQRVRITLHEAEARVVEDAAGREE